ncbi:PopZ family protein [Neorhizobium petrolearium]|uniref:PopZ family protein n=1 Tax=Neorhizobium petrolearium TaxID=515361 RepID=UPI003F17257A
MAQPSVAREPSMEEILASIRRIIESNEPNAENASLRPLPPAYEDEIDEAEEADFGPDAAANDPGLPTRNEAMNQAPAPVPAGQPAQPERSLSLADVAARVRAASARQQEAGNVQPAVTATAPAAAVPVPAAPAALPEEQVPLRSQSPRMPEVPRLSEFRGPSAAPAVQPVLPQSEPVDRAVPPAFEPPQPAAARAEAPALHEPKLAAAPEPQSLPAKIEEAASLLSAEAGAQVAKSFSDLAAVFNGIERRSLEEMAQDMLRPMLQEWLDDNLPTLVERLVREEIERVARGPRR